MLAYLIETIYSILWKCGIYGGFVLFLLLVTLYYYQDRMLYVTNMPSPQMKYPEMNPKMFKSPSEYDLDFEEVSIETSDFIKLHGWFIKVSE